MQPAVTCQTANSWTVFWVGLDGWDSNAVEQGGSYALCGAVGSTPVYSLWWEMWPTNAVQAVTLPQQVQPGDVIQATVTYNPNASNYIIAVEDVTTSQGFAEVQTCAANVTCENASAEVVTEAPGYPLPPVGPGGLYSLANYGTMAYTSASVTDSSGSTGALNAPQWTSYSISETNDTPPDYSSVSPLNTNGNGFSVTWVPSAANSQTIVFTSTPPPNAVVGGPTYAVTATGGGSGNPVVISIDAQSTGVCSLSGNVVSFIGAGTCTLDANQAGYSLFPLPAPQVQQMIAVGTSATQSAVTLYVAIGGNDTGNCQASLAPCATISYAVSQALNGDTIDLGPGTFAATVANAEGVSLTIQGSSSGTAPATTVESANPTDYVFGSGRGGLTLDHLTINGLSGVALVSGYAGYMNVTDSTITNSSTAVIAGAVGGSVDITDSTISGNTVGVNDAPSSGGASITASTIANNGVGIEMDNPASYSVTDSIVGRNSVKDCVFPSGTVISGGGYNLDDDGSCGFSGTSSSDKPAGLNPAGLQNNGGPTQTIALTPGSSAIGGVNNSTLCSTPDQRGVTRPTPCNIGAYQAVGLTSVGTLANKSGTGATTVAVSPQHGGDLLALAIKVYSSSITASSVSGGGANTWTRAANVSEDGNDLQIWIGTVSTTGTSTITVTFSGSVTSTYTGLAVHEFSASSGSGTVWGIDSASGISNASSTTVTFPKLTPTGTGELYFGYAAVANNAAAGSTSGFSYATTSDADVATYNTNVSAAVQPTAKQSPAGASGAVAVFITASPSSSSVTVPGPPTITSVVPGNGQLTVNFTPGSNGGSPFTAFTITCGSLSVSASGAATSATVSQLTNGTKYSCTVSASNVNGSGPPSTAATGTPSAATVAPTITSVGTLANKSGTGATTVAVSPQHGGDLLALAIKVYSSSITASSVSGGGASTWTRAANVSEDGNDLQIWIGTVSTTGTSTITVTFSGSVTSTYTGLAVHEFSASSGSGTVWGIDSASGISNASSTTVTFPKLTPTGTGELYFGYAAVANNAAAGSTSGFSYATTSDADVATYNTNVSAAVQPTAKQSPAGASGAVAVFITAST